MLPKNKTETQNIMRDQESHAVPTEVIGIDYVESVRMALEPVTATSKAFQERTYSAIFSFGRLGWPILSIISTLV